MFVAMETTLFLLLSMGTWAQSSMAMYTPQTSYDSFGTVSVTDPNLGPMHTLQEDYDSFGAESVTDPNLSSMTFTPVLTRDLEKNDDPGDHIRALSPSDVTSLETSTDGLLSVPTVLQEISTNKSVVSLNVSDTTNDTAIFIATNSLGGQVVTDESLAAGSPKPTDEATDATLSLATSSPEFSSETAESTFILTTGSLEPTSGAMDSTFDPATDSPEPSSGATGSPLIPSTGSLDLSKGTSEPSFSMVTSSLKTPTEVSPTDLVERSITTSLKDSTKISRPSPNPNKGMKGTLLPVIVTLLVFLVLVVLLVLWRQRQKRHSGVLTLNGATKRNGVDAWAGRAPVSGEEVLTVTVAETQNDNGSEVPQGEVCGRRPTLTTFFGRRKSCQDSVALEDLGPGAAPGLKPEEESLIGAGDSAGDAVEAPTFDGLEAGGAGGGEPPSSCE